MSQFAIVKSNLEGHSGGVNSVAFHPTAPLLASGSKDGTAKLWRFSPDGSAATCVATTLPEPFIIVISDVNSVAFHPTEPLLATGYRFENAKVWRFSPEGSEANNMEVTCVAIMKEHRASINSVAFYPNTPLLATGSDNGNTILWSFDPEGPEVNNNVEEKWHKVVSNNRKSIWSVAFHPTLPLLANGSDDYTAKLWYINESWYLHGLKTKCVATLEGHKGGIFSVAFHRTEHLLATGSGDRTARLWRFKPDGLAVNNMQVTCVAILSESSGGVMSVAFHPTELLLATGSSDNTAKLWRFKPDGSAVTLVTTLKGHSNWVWSVAFHPTAPLLATGSYDNTIKIWELNLENILSSSILPTLTITHYESRIKIGIPIELRLESKESNKNSCPNFKPLYDQFMSIELKKQFHFEYIGETGIDVTGLTRIVFDKLLPVYTQLYFVKTGEFILLKQDANIEELNRDTLQLIKLAKAARSQIYLPIHPQLLELLLLLNPPESIASSNNFNDLYANLKNRISAIIISGNSISNYLPNNSKNQQITSVENINKLSKTIKAEIILRKKLYDFAFTSWIQYINMATFIKTFWNKGNKLRFFNRTKNVEFPLFTCELKYDIKSFESRLQIKREETSQFLNLQKIEQSLYQQYPALQPLLEYILNSDPAADINRRKFVKYVAGTEYTSCVIIISLQTVEIPFSTINRNKIYELPFLAHTCFSTLDLFKTPRSKNYQEVWTVARINEEITKGTSFSAHNR